MEPDDRVRDAVRLLIGRAFDRVDGHPAGHLLSSQRENLELSLKLPLSLRDEDLDAAAARAEKELDAAVEGLLVHRSIFKPGRVLCIRCRTTECEHATTDDPRQVFTGYSQSGIPAFVDLGEFLLTEQDPRVGELFADKDSLVTRVMLEKDLGQKLLPSFRRDQKGYRIHGQVVAGWYRIPDETGKRRAMALSFQVISSTLRGRETGRRYGLNVLGSGPGGEALEHLHDRLRVIPWTGTVRWAQSILRTTRQPTHRRIEGLLGGLARRLERKLRSSERRTAHAEEHHAEGSRPTRMALMDLARAEDDALHVDCRHDTRIIVGPRGRCHVFSAAGQLVTSVRYAAGSIDRKRKTGTWRPASTEEVNSLRELAIRANTDNSDKSE